MKTKRIAARREAIEIVWIWRLIGQLMNNSISATILQINNSAAIESASAREKRENLSKKIYIRAVYEAKISDTE